MNRGGGNSVSTGRLLLPDVEPAIGGFDKVLMLEPLLVEEGLVTTIPLLGGNELVNPVTGPVPPAVVTVVLIAANDDEDDSDVGAPVDIS